MMKRTADLSKAFNTYKIEYSNEYKEFSLKLNEKYEEKHFDIEDFPIEIQTIINQVLYISNIKDFISISVTIFPPAKKYSQNKTTISSAESGILDRFISICGFKEKIEITPVFGNIEGQYKYILPNDLLHFYNGAGSGFDIFFDDQKSTKRPQKNGYRSGIIEKKDPTKRSIIVIDIEPTSERLTNTMTKIAGKISKKCSDVEKIKELEQNMRKDQLDILEDNDIDLDDLANGLIGH